MPHKLFTKQIDEMLFKQYELGSNLENQKVVAKIFNPYGRGTWYLLNSDPNDPDYIWAIVDLFDVEMGSVSRKDLESIKVPPFNLKLERDLYFQPKNAKEVYDNLMKGVRYEDGGMMARGGNLTSKYKYVPNRLIQSVEVERNGKTTDIDGANILDGIYVKKGVRFDRGGYNEPPNQYLVYMKSDNPKYQDEDGFEGNPPAIYYADSENEVRDYLDENLPNDVELVSIDELEPIETYADGGGIGEKVKIVVKSNYGEKYDNVWYLTKAGDTTHLFLSNSPDFKGNAYHVGQFNREPFYNDLKSWLKGGENIDGKEYMENKYADGGVAITGEQDGNWVANAGMFGDGGKISEANKYAKGGGVGQTELLEKELRRLQRDLNSSRLRTYREGDTSQEQQDRFREREVKLKRFNEVLSLLRQMDENKYADGGTMDVRMEDTVQRMDDPNFADVSMYAKGGKIKIGDKVRSTVFKGVEGEVISKDKNMLFVRRYNALPSGDFQHDVLRIDEVEKLSEGGEMDEYAKGGGVGKFEVGDTVMFEGEEYYISKISNDRVAGFIDFKWFLDPVKKGGKKLVLDSPKGIVSTNKYAKGGEIMKHKHYEYITIELIEPTNKGWKVKQIETHATSGKKLSKPKEKIQYFTKQEIKELFEPIMATGGMTNKKVKFSDKAKAIKERLLKYKKVSPSVQKDYGKTYSPAEAEESAKRIAGAMRKKEMAKKKR